jgi:ATP/maltotriose-dependent transcriptional regulator MalT
VLPDELGRYGDAVPLLDRVLEYVEEHDLEGYVLSALGARARVRFERGEWAGALADADAVLERGGRRGVNAVLPLVVRGRVLSARGQDGARQELDDAAREAEPLGDVQYLAPVVEALSEHHLLEGDADRAAEEARRGLALATSVHGQPVVLGRLAHRLWRAGGEVPADLAIAAPFRALVDGDWAGAARLWSDLGAPYPRAEALAHGDRAAAVEALRVLDGLGAVRVAAEVRARMRRRGLVPVPRGPAAATRAHPAGLTAREVEVLGLLRGGATNTEIAGRLVLSVRTVDHHVSAILAKLGSSSRGEAVEHAGRLGI